MVLFQVESKTHSSQQGHGPLGLQRHELNSPPTTKSRIALYLILTLHLRWKLVAVEIQFIIRRSGHYIFVRDKVIPLEKVRTMGLCTIYAKYIVVPVIVVGLVVITGPACRLRNVTWYLRFIRSPTGLFFRTIPVHFRRFVSNPV